MLFRSQDPLGGIAQIVNVLSKLNPILDDVPWVEGNLPTGHRITQAANALPSATWRKLNAGVTATKGETAQYDESCGMLEDLSEVDVDLAKLNGDAAAFRASEDKLKMEGISQQFATALWYESVSTNPERIHGLAPRYPATTGYTSSTYTLTGATLGGGANSCVNCQTVWLVSWEPRKVYGIYPKATTAGLQVEDKGEWLVTDPNASTKQFWAYVTKFQWKCGIAVEDYRYAVRMQWDPDDALFADNDKGLYLLMQYAMQTVFQLLPSSRFYMSRTSKRKLDAQLASNHDKFLDYISPQGMSGLRIPTFMGVPIRVVDSLVAETAIS